jgi:hypothetical protein
LVSPGVHLRCTGMFQMLAPESVPSGFDCLFPRKLFYMGPLVCRVFDCWLPGWFPLGGPLGGSRVCSLWHSPLGGSWLGCLGWGRLQEGFSMLSALVCSLGGPWRLSPQGVPSRGFHISDPSGGALQEYTSRVCLLGVQLRWSQLDGAPEGESMMSYQ